MNRIDRLTAILIHLQSKKVVRAEEIANRYGISLRTVYRDVKALMEAGVPIGSEAGKGYFIVNGYHLPPVMFTQDEAATMLLAGKLIEKLGDKSVRTSFDAALLKVKAVLNEAEKNHLESLHDLVQVLESPRSDASTNESFPDNFLTTIQRALVKRQVLLLDYTNNKEELSTREVEPVGIFYYSSAWHLIGWCRLRQDYRDFRSDRIRKLVLTDQVIEKKNQISLQDYLQRIDQLHEGLVKAVVHFDKASMRGRQVYGAFAQEDVGTSWRVEFVMDNLQYIARMLLMYGRAVRVESPEELKIILAEQAADLAAHHSREAALKE